jgi:hypothetical protein
VPDSIDDKRLLRLLAMPDPFGRGAASFAAEAIGTARAARYGGTDIVRADSAYYFAAFCSAVRQAGAWFSVTMNTDPRSPPPSSGGTSATRCATTWHHLELLLCRRITR